MKPKDDKLYNVLGVTPEATPQEVHRAYRKAAKETHPDMGGTPEKFALVKLAADVLGDAKRRAHYNATGDASEKAVDNETASALEILTQCIHAALDFALTKNIDITTLNMMADFNASLTKKRAEYLEAIEQNRVAMSQLKRLHGRFKRKKRKKKDDPEPPNFMENIIAGNMRGLQSSIDMMRDKIRHLELAMTILNDHSFDRTDLATQIRAFRASSSTTSTWG